MSHRILNPYILLLAFILAACSNTPTPPASSPQPARTLPPPPTAETLIRPSATPILTNTPTSDAAVESNLVLVAAAITDGYYSLLNVTISSRSQLAYIRDGHLLVETTPGSTTFQDLGPGAQVAAWSPDGSQLAYSVADFDVEPSHFEQFIWKAETGAETNLAQQIPNFPNPAYSVYKIFWSPDSSKILLWAQIDDRHEPVEGGPFSAILSVVDLNQQTFTDNEVVPSIKEPVWLTNDQYILQDDPANSDSVIYTANDYTGHETWSLEWATFGVVGFAPDGRYMINAGRIGGKDDRGLFLEARPATIDKINLTSGEAETIWQTNPQAPEQYFARVYGIRISPDGQYLAFSSSDRLENGYSVLLHLIDLKGQEFGEYRETYAHNWRPNDGLVVSDTTENDVGRLIYIELDGTKEIFYETQIGRTTIKGGNDWLDNAGVWSADGRTFAFATRDNGAKIEQLYLWQPGQSPPTTIFTSLANERIDDFYWVPNSPTLYFNTVGADPDINSKLWRYDVPTS